MQTTTKSSTAIQELRESVNARLVAIEAKFDAMLATLTSTPDHLLMATPERVGLTASLRIALANLPFDALLVGWVEISRYARKSPRALRRYVKLEGFPAFRWGRHVVAARHNIDTWLVAREEVRRQRQRQASTG